jgi:hypothetical protein
VGLFKQSTNLELSMNTKTLRWAVSALMLCVLAACGGGGSGGSSTDNGSQDNSGSGSGGNSSGNTADLVANVAPASYSGDYATEKAAVFALLNAYRSQCGFGMLAQNSLLDQAAQNHAQYSRVVDQGHFETAGVAGFTGVTAGDRVLAAGYQYSSGGEVIGYQGWGSFYANSSNSHSLISVNQLLATSNLKTILTGPYHLQGAMQLDRDVGIGIHNHQISQDSQASLGSSIKVLNINLATLQGVSKQRISNQSIATFPCDGSTGLAPVFGEENPDPFPGSNRSVSPYGHPVYVTTATGSTVTLDAARSTITPRGGVALPTRLLTQSNDPNGRLTSNQVFLVPTTRLADNTTYDVVLNGTLSTLITDANPTGTWSRAFTFYTGAFRGE